MRSRSKSLGKILILGEPATSKVISDQLQDLGYETLSQNFFNSFHLPPTGQSKGLKTLKDLFVQFASHIASQPGTEGLIHPGTSAWAERPELTALARRLNLKVIGPPVRIQYLFGNQLYLLLEAEKLDIPNLIQWRDPLYTVREVENFLEKSGQSFPFVLRSVRGGGSFGTWVVHDEKSLKKLVPIWFDQLRWKMGEVIVFVEKYIEGARQVSVPFVRFRDGRVQIFPKSDVSLQCKYQKIVEFCPADSIEPQVDRLMSEWTKQFIDKCDYVGVGSLEYSVDGARVFLKSGVARLNSGFHLWEEVAGTRAVAWQLAAVDLLLNQPEMPPELSSRDQWKHGCFMKVLAEDSLFLLPRPGVVHEIAFQKSGKNEFYSNYTAGESILCHDSGTVGHLFAFSDSFQSVIRDAKDALSKLWIAGSLETNEKQLFELLSHPWVEEGIFHSGFIDDEFIASSGMTAALFPLAVWVVNQHPELKHSTSLSGWQVNERMVRLNSDSAPESRWSGNFSYWNKDSLPGVSGWAGGLKDNAGEQVYQVCAYPVEAGKWIVRLGELFLRVRQVQPTQEGRSVKKGSKFTALATGRVHVLFYREGTVIPPHEPVLIIESLGVFVPHSLPHSIRVKNWKIRTNDRVVLGQDLAEFDVVSVSGAVV